MIVHGIALVMADVSVIAQMEIICIVKQIKAYFHLLNLMLMSTKKERRVQMPKSVKPNQFIPLIRSENKVLEKKLFRLELSVMEGEENDYTESCYTESCYTESCYTESCGEFDFKDDSMLRSLIEEINKEIGYPETDIRIDSMPIRKNAVLTLLSKENLNDAQKKWPELRSKIIRRIRKKDN